MINFVRRGSNVGDWVLRNHFLLGMTLFHYSRREARFTNVCTRGQQFARISRTR